MDTLDQFPKVTHRAAKRRQPAEPEFQDVAHRESAAGFKQERRRINSIRRVVDLSFPRLALAFFQTCGFASAFTQIEQFRTANASMTLHFDMRNLRRVHRELSFHSFALNNSANNEHFTRAGAAASDYYTAENLDAFFCAFQNSRVDINTVTDRKLQRLLTQAGLFSASTRLFRMTWVPYNLQGGRPLDPASNNRPKLQTEHIQHLLIQQILTPFGRSLQTLGLLPLVNFSVITTD